MTLAAPSLPATWAERRAQVESLLAAALRRVVAADLATPVLLLDPAVAVERLRALQQALPHVELLYAVKANPASELVAALVAAGAGLDVASEGEIAAAAGVPGARMSFGHPVKSRGALRAARAAGVGVYAVDSPAELVKLAEEVPGAGVLVRLTCAQEGADWPLAGKFGVPADEALGLLHRAAGLGLTPRGVAFHVGSQQRDAGRWADALRIVEDVVVRGRSAGLPLDLVNVGGGLAAVTGHASDAGDLACASAPDVAEVAVHLLRAQAALGPGVRWTAEPGRYLAAECGVLVARVVGVAERAGERWAYLDAGVFHGLVETEGEVTRYPLATTGLGDPAPTVLAGPTCDSADVMYRRCRPVLPRLVEGDLVAFGAAGAYTTTYSSVSFNGFGPVPTVAVRLA